MILWVKYAGCTELMLGGLDHVKCVVGAGARFLACGGFGFGFLGGVFFVCFLHWSGLGQQLVVGQVSVLVAFC